MAKFSAVRFVGGGGVGRLTEERGWKEKNIWAGGGGLIQGIEGIAAVMVTEKGDKSV